MSKLRATYCMYTSLQKVHVNLRETQHLAQTEHLTNLGETCFNFRDIFLSSFDLLKTSHCVTCPQRDFKFLTFCSIAFS